MNRIELINSGKASTGNSTIDAMNAEYIDFLGGRMDTEELFRDWLKTQSDNILTKAFFVGALRPWVKDTR